VAFLNQILYVWIMGKSKQVYDASSDEYDSDDDVGPIVIQEKPRSISEPLSTPSSSPIYNQSNQRMSYIVHSILLSYR
jgi:hypothetical protein